MRFRHLQDNLRRIVLARIQAGEITGLGLASRIGFQQAHISNFLNGKRNLSLDAMDEVLKALHISVVDLIQSEEPHRASANASSQQSEYDSVAIVSSETAASEPIVPLSKSLDELHFKRSFLRRLRPDMVGDRSLWTRFLLIRADARNAAAMYPRFTTGATLLIDRHYNSLKPYRRNEQNMYAVRKAGACIVRYVALHGSQLSLRPQSDTTPLDYVPIASGRSFAEYVVGRICYVGVET